jgi:CHAT domain-containing protein
VPFQVLQDLDGRYLADRFRISYAPSAGVLQRLGTSGRLAGSAVLAVAGPDLPEAMTEAEDIVRLYPKGSKVVPEKSATTTYLKSNAGGYDVLHVAAHGKFNPKQPLLSHIQLTPGDADDGKWSAGEMFALPLRQVKLVTLSACETGRVAGTQSSEVIGMPRALIYAGAKSVLLTHWKVNSQATLEWMKTFYQEAARSSCTEAAQRATTALRARSQYAHPFYWGAFYLVGR